MAYDFPSSPTVGDVYPLTPTTGQWQYTWDGQKWTMGAYTPEGPGPGGDTTPPILSALSGGQTSNTAASYVVTTDEANGNLYWVVVPTAAVPPDANHILFGQDGIGNPAVDSGNQPVTAVGVQLAFTPNGLTAVTAYDVYVTHRDAASNNSNVVTDEFTTNAGADVTPPTLSALTGGETSYSAASYVVSTNEANGTIYWIVSLTVVPTPTPAQVIAGLDGNGVAAADSGSQGASGIGPQAAMTPNGLTSNTAYDFYVVHRDAALNISNMQQDEFTTLVHTIGAPTISLWPASDTGTPGDNITSDTTPDLGVVWPPEGIAQNGRIYVTANSSPVNVDGVGYHVVTLAEAGGAALTLTGMPDLTVGTYNIVLNYIGPGGAPVGAASNTLPLSIVAAGYDSDAVAIWTSFATPASDPRKTAINNCVLALKTGLTHGTNTWAKLDILHMRWAADADAASKNWKIPGTNNGTVVSTPTFVADRGYTSLGSGGDYITTASNVNTLTNFQQDSASFGVWKLTAGSGTDGLCGSTGYGNLFQTSGGGMIFRINAAGGVTAGTAGNTAGLFVANRVNSTEANLYENGVAVGVPQASASVAREANPFWFLQVPAVQASSSQQAMGFVGGGMTDNEHADFHAAMAQYKTAVGA